MSGMGDLRQEDLDTEAQRRENEALGRLLFEKYYSHKSLDDNGVQVPQMDRSAMNYVLPGKEDISNDDRDRLQAYIRKIHSPKSFSGSDEIP